MRSALDPSFLRDLYNNKASHYDLAHGLLTMWSDQRGRRLVVDLAVRPGDRVLDAGGGTGSTSLLAARKVGPDGRVMVLDLSPGMLEEARLKARAAGLEERMDFCLGDIAELPFQQPFDSVLSTYSLCPLGDPSEAVLQLYGLVKPGGRLAAAHSVEPEGALIKTVAAWVEGLAWKFPWLSMGCRPVETLPALMRAGAELQFETRLGVPLWPFLVYAVQKPQS